MGVKLGGGHTRVWHVLFGWCDSWNADELGDHLKDSQILTTHPESHRRFAEDHRKTGVQACTHVGVNAGLIHVSM